MYKNSTTSLSYFIQDAECPRVVNGKFHKQIKAKENKLSRELQPSEGEGKLRRQTFDRDSPQEPHHRVVTSGRLFLSKTISECTVCFCKNVVLVGGQAIGLKENKNQSNLSSPFVSSGSNKQQSKETNTSLNGEKYYVSRPPPSLVHHTPPRFINWFRLRCQRQSDRKKRSRSPLW